MGHGGWDRSQQLTLADIGFAVNRVPSTVNHVSKYSITPIFGFHYE
jgi:hypothetical protein